MSNKEKPFILYKTFSVYAQIKLAIFRLTIVFLTVIAAYNIGENPVAITIFILILGLLFFASGNERIYVFSDKFVYQSGSILRLLSLRKRINYEGIKRVSCEGINSKTIDLISNGSGLYNKIYIEDDKGDLRIIRTNIYIDELKEAVNTINKQLLSFKKHNSDQRNRL